MSLFDIVEIAKIKLEQSKKSSDEFWKRLREEEKKNQALTDEEVIISMMSDTVTKKRLVEEKWNGASLGHIDLPVSYYQKIGNTRLLSDRINNELGYRRRCDNVLYDITRKWLPKKVNVELIESTLSKHWVNEGVASVQCLNKSCSVIRFLFKK